MHVLPPDVKTGNDPPAALIIGRSGVIHQLKNMANLVWYNMDHVHRGRLLNRLSMLPALPGTHATKLGVEATRTPNRTRFDFNETRTHLDDELQKGIAKLASCTAHAELIRLAHATAAGRHQVPEDAVQLFRGANEAIKTSIRAIAQPNTSVLLTDVGYIGHVKAAVAAGARIHYLPLASGLLGDLTRRHLTPEGLLRAIEEVRPHLVVLANPSNPLGELLTEAEFRWLFEASCTLTPKPVFIIDAAFERFAREGGQPVPHYRQHIASGRLLIVESLSKADGYAGSRAGYIYGGSELVHRVARAHPADVPISPLGAATIALSRSSKNDELVRRTVNALQREIHWFTEAIRRRVSACEVRIGFGSFVLLKVPSGTRDLVVQKLRLAHMDVSLVARFFETAQGAAAGRYPDICGEPLPDLIRISLGRHHENLVLFHELRSCMVALERTGV